MKTGLPVKTVAQILNITPNYVYRLVREKELELSTQDPYLISSQSVRDRLMKLVPFLAQELAIRTDYQIKQYEVAA